MTVSASYSPNVSTGNGVTTVFPYSFRILSSADLEVTVDGVAKTLGVDYTVSGVGAGGGGNVTFTAAPANTTKVVLRRNMALARATDYQDNGDLLARVLNQDNDAAVMLVQQLQEQADRSLKFPVGDASSTILPAAALRANRAVFFDGDGNMAMSADIPALAAAAAQSATNAEASRDAIDNRIYPGTYAANPTTRPDGSAIQEGDRYFNSGDDNERIYRSGAWVNFEAAAAVSAAAAETAQGLSEDARDASVIAQGLSEAAQAAAETAKVAAEAARDSANTTGKVFSDTTAGIAGTTSGQTFAVLDASLQFWIVYKNNAGVAQEVARNYTKAYIDTLVDANYGDTTAYLYAIVDSAKRLLAAWKTDGTLLAKLGVSVGVANGLTFTRNSDGSYMLSLGTTQGELPIGSTALLRGEYDNSDNLYAITDSAGRKLLWITGDGTVNGKLNATETEAIAARGSRASLDARISQQLSAYGQPKRHTWGEWYLRETRYRLRKRAMGESAQLVVAAIGDSWTHGRTRWAQPVASALISAYGDAGSGWTGFGNGGGTNPNGNVDTSKVTVTYSGTWDYSVYYSSPSPDLGQVTTSTVGTKLTITGPDSCSVAKLFWIGATGAVRYRWDGGAWTNLTLDGSGLLTTNLAGMPATAWTLEIEHVSGAATLCGLDIQKSTDGVRFHKLGSTGSAAQQWQSPTAAQWQAGLATLAPNLVVIMLGTNDQSGYAPSLYDTYMRTLIGRVKAACPLADVLLVQPCENGRVNTYAMSLYTEKMYIAAADLKCAFLDLQYVFGDTFSEYASTSARAWFNADLIHPEPNTGGRVITDAVVRLLTSAA